MCGHKRDRAMHACMTSAQKMSLLTYVLPSDMYKYGTNARTRRRMRCGCFGALQEPGHSRMISLTRAPDILTLTILPLLLPHPSAHGPPVTLCTDRLDGSFSSRRR